MAFLNDLGKKLGGVAEVAAEKAKVAAGAAADKAKELAEVAKLNNEISAEQKQIDSLYAEIGKVIFERDKNDALSPVAEQCQKILAAQQSIAELNIRIQQVKAGDDRVVEAEVTPVTPSAEQPVKKFCANCGTEIAPGSKFCQSCGSPSN